MGILKISAKCSDLCWTKYTDKNGKETETNGYVPEGIGIGDGGGDYIDIDIDMKTGQILNWKPVSDAQVIEAQKKV
jgi:hypothetical protein